MIVAAAERVGPGAPEPPEGSDLAAAGELRRSLEALTDDEIALSRAMRRPLTIDRLGRHPLGNLVIRSLASAFGDLGTASSWLSAQLGITGSVLPATPEPLQFTIEVQPAPPGEPSSSHALDRIRFIPDRPRVSAGVVTGVRRAGLVLVAPGSLFRSVLVATAIPDIAKALRVTPARVIWICNLVPEHGETVNEHFAALRRHGVRVDAVLYDPDASLRLEAQEFHDQGVATIPRRLVGATCGVHDPQLLRAALSELLPAHHQHA